MMKVMGGFGLWVAEPKMAKYLLNLPPDASKKTWMAGEFIFAGDRLGFNGGLLMDEGTDMKIRRAFRKKFPVDFSLRGLQSENGKWNSVENGKL